MLEGCFYHLDGGFLFADLSITRTRSGEGLSSFDLLIVREVPTTRQPRSSSACSEAQADSAGSAGDDGDGLLGSVHRMYFWLNLCFLR